MAEGYVIGVDLGGTKLLAGAVDADLSVIHRTNRLVYGLSQDELVQMIVDAMEEIRNAVGGHIEAIGFGIPCTFDKRTGMAVQAVNVPLKDIAFADVVCERLGVPVVVDAGTHARLWDLVESDPTAELSVDLEAQAVRLPNGETIAFEVDPFARMMLLAGTDELGYLLEKEPAIAAWESAHPPRVETRAGAGAPG